MMKFRIRYVLILLIFMVGAVVNIDRSNISIAGAFLAVDYHISKVQLGWVFSAFMLGYAVFLIPAGWIVGKIGPRRTLTAGLVWWSVLSLGTGLVPSHMASALWILIAVRFVLGMGEAVAYPSANQFIAAWFPSAERGRANAWVQGGAQFGSGIAPPFIALIIYNFGWRAAFAVSAIIGLGIAVLWHVSARDNPALHSRVTPQELAHIRAGLPVRMEGQMPKPPWRKIFTNVNVLCTALAYIGFGYSATIFSTWFFIYLKDGRGFDLKSSALLGVLPFIATTSCCLIGGMVSDWLVKHRSQYLGRSVLGAFTLFSSGIILIFGSRSPDAIVAALLLSAGAGTLYLGQSIYYAVAADLGGQFTGIVSGFISMCGQIAGAATATLTPFFASQYGWEHAFYIASGVNFACIIPWLFVRPDRGLYTMPDNVK